MSSMVGFFPPVSGSARRSDVVARGAAGGPRNWRRRSRALAAARIIPYLWSAAGVAVAAIAGLGMTALVPLPNASMIFLLAVVFSAARFGIWPALLASSLSFLAYNFFFIEPLYTFTVAQPHELLALCIFLLVAVLTSTIAGRARDQASAAETERVRNTLLASVSHDFRTPLASILGAATSLIDYEAKLPDEARRDLLAQVKQEAEHLDGMVRNLLAITRVEAGGLEVNRDWVDVREIFDRGVAVAKRRGAPQSFEVIAEDDLPFVSADPNLLGQVVSNLIGNAARYAGPAAHVVLEARREADEMVLSVADDGPGIPADVLPRVFEKFSRAPQAGDARDGTGLGLAIAKGIIDAHGGTVVAQSPIRGGRGTRILMRLPLQTAAQ